LRLQGQNHYGVLLTGNLTEVDIAPIRERLKPVGVGDDYFFSTTQTSTPQDKIVSRWLYSDDWYVYCGDHWRGQNPLMGFLTIVDLEAIRRFVEPRLRSFVIEEHREPFLEPLEYRLAEEIPLISVQSSVVIRAPQTAELSQPKTKSDLLCPNLEPS
jgi:hypothetical protein